MRLDDLISKYLDGELTYEEDMELMKLIADDPNSKSQFDSAIYLNSAFREDAENINPPAQLVRDTEDKILMKILADKPIQQDTPYIFKKRFAMSLLTICILILAVIRIDNDFINNKVISTYLSEMLENHKQKLDILLFGPEEKVIYTIRNNETLAFSDTKVSEQNKEKKLNHSISNSGSATFIAENSNIDESANVLKNSSLLDKSANDNSELSNTFGGTSDNIANSNTRTNENNDKTSSTDFFDINSNLKKSKSNNLIDKNINNSLLAKPVEISPENNGYLNKPSYNLNLDEKYYNSMVINPYSLYGQNSDIQLSSFLGTDVFRSGINTTNNVAITHFSQGISYSFNEKQRIGIEIGFTQYSYFENTKVTIPVSKPMVILTQAEGALPEDEFISFPVQLNREKQLIWGGAFYEHSLFSNSNFDLNGRIGGGSSSEGFLGYSRIFAKYDIIKNFSLTLGTEGRIFVASIPKLNTNKSLKSSVSLIYGFQVKF